MKRGQAAVEYVILTGVLLIFLVPIIQSSLVQTSTQLRLSQLDDSFTRLTKSVDAVGALSIGAQEMVTITTPSGIESIAIAGKAIEVQVSMGGSLQDMGYLTSIPLVGNIPTNAGTYHIRVKKESDQLVNITLKESP